MNSLKVFNNEQLGEVRVIVNESGDPLFCLVDICRALNIQNAAQVAQRLDEDERYMFNIGRQGNTTFVTESGLYTVILRSDSLMAKPMQKWVTSEVLPSIRKHGAYLTPEKIEETLLNPDTIIRLATALKEEREQKERLRAQNELQHKQLKESAGKVDYYNSVLQSETAITTTVIAKELGMSAYSLNGMLHRNKIIFKSGKTWVLFSQYQNKGYTKTKTIHYTDSLGVEKTEIHTYWTEVGREFIHQFIKKARKEAA